MATRLEQLGGTTELKDIGKQVMCEDHNIFHPENKQFLTATYFFFKQQTLHDGSVLDLPPVMFGKLGNDPAKKTVMLYGHLDVQPALKVNAI